MLLTQESLMNLVSQMNLFLLTQNIIMRSITRMFSYILIYTLSFSSFGQNLDSLKVAWNKATLENAPNQFALLKEISTAYIYTNLDSATHYAQIMIQGVKKTDDKLSLAKAYNSLSDIYNMQGRYQEAVVPLEKSIEICKALKSVKGLTVNTYLKGNIFQNLQKYQAADSSYNESLEMAKANQDTTMMANNYKGLGMNNEYLGKLDDAIDYYFKAVDLFAAKGNKYGLATSYTNIGTLYSEIKQYEKAFEYYNKAIVLKKDLKNYSGLALTYFNLGDLYLAIDNLEQGASDLDSALHYATISNNTGILSHAYFSKGDVFYKKKDFRQAETIYQKGLKIAEEQKDSFRIARGNECIGRVYSELGDYEKAKVFFEDGLSFAERSKSIETEKRLILPYISAAEKHNAHKDLSKLYSRLLVINDSLFSLQKVVTINEVEAKYQTEKKEKENQLLKTEGAINEATIKSQKTILFSSLIGVLLLSIISFLVFRQNKNQKKINQILADKNQKIELLHKELSHRVKNNLTFISGLMQLQEARLENQEAKRAVKEGENRIEAISLLHRKLYLEQEQTSIDIGTYLEELCGNLQNTYPYKTTRPNINVKSDEIQTNGEVAIHIGLIINELVTNSFKYAFTDHPSPNIDIRLKKTKPDAYQLTYQDNGKGLPDNMDIAKIKSLGLKLIQMLTQQLNGKLNIQNGSGAHFEIDFTNPNISV